MPAATLEAGPAGPSFAALCRRVRARYGRASRYARHYVGFKLRLDPVHRAVLDLAREEPLGAVLDLGCGRGQLGFLLLDAGLATALTGIDWDGAELRDARAAGPDARFIEGDLASATLPPCDTALLVDVLYQMDTHAQLALLERAGTATRRLVIRTFDPGQGWRSLVGWLSEAGIWTLGLYRQARIRPTPLAVLTGSLERLGFACEVRPCWSGTPLPNILLVARRP